MTGKAAEQVALHVEPEPDQLTDAAAREVEHQLRPLTEPIAKLGQAVAELQGKAARIA
jgi:hypothetical protein